MNLSDIAVLDIHGDILNIHCCITSGISKSKVVDLLENIDLIQKGRAAHNVENL